MDRHLNDDGLADAARDQRNGFSSTWKMTPSRYSAMKKVAKVLPDVSFLGGVPDKFRKI